MVENYSGKPEISLASRTLWNVDLMQKSNNTRKGALIT